MKNSTLTKPFAKDKQWNDTMRHIICKKAIELRSEGIQSAATVAASTFGCSHASVYNWMGRLGYSQAYFNI